MYLKHKLHIYLFCVVIAAHAVYAKTFNETVKELLSFKLPKDIFGSVNETIVGKLQAKKVSLSLPNKITIDGMEVLDEFGQRVLYSKEITLTISLLSLLTKNIRITDAVINSPFFRYTIKNNIHNITRLFEDPPSRKVIRPKERSKIRITIEKVLVQNGSYEMVHDAGVLIKAFGINAVGNFWVEEGPFGVDISQADIKGSTITAGSMSLPITNLVAKKLLISDKKVAADDLVANYEKAVLKGQGTVFIDSEKYDIKASLDAPLGTYPTGLKPLPLVLPAFKAIVKMSGALTEPQFDANLELGSTNFNGLLIKKGVVRTKFNRHKVTLDSVHLDVGQQGSMTAQGIVDIDKGWFSFSSKQYSILAQEISQFLSFKKPTKGLVSADSKFEGSFVGKEPNIRMTSVAQVKNGGIIDVNLADITKLSFDIDYVFDKKLKIHQAAVSDSRGLKATLSGEGDVATKTFQFSFDASCAQPNLYVSLIKPSDELTGVFAKGTLGFVADDLSVHAVVKAKVAQFSGVQGEDVEGTLNFSHDELKTVLKAKFYQGVLDATLAVSDFGGKKKLLGTASFSDANLFALTRPFTSFNIEGSMASSIDIAGTLENPLVSFSSEIEELVLNQTKFVSSQILGQLADHTLSISRFSAIAQSGMLESSQASLDLTSKKISGFLSVSNVNIASALSSVIDGIDGDLTGPVVIKGTLLEPEITAPMTVKNLVSYGVKLGSGALTLRLERLPLLPNKTLVDLVFSVSGNLLGPSSSNVVRFSLAVKKETINVEAKFNDLELNTAELSFLDFDRLALLGRVSGTISAQGAWRSPYITADVVALEYGLFDPKIRKDAIKINKTYGPLVVQASNKEGRLNLNLCASLLKPTNKKCQGDMGVELTVSGPFSFHEFNLDVLGSINHDHIEDLVFGLKNELISLNAQAQIQGKISKKRDKQVDFDGQITVNKLLTSLPNIPKIALKDPVMLHVQNNSIKLINNAVLQFSPGQLEVRGLVSKSAVDMHFLGAIPLVLARFFIPILQGADGLARGDIVISGSPDALVLEGKVTPDPGALLLFRKWIEPVEVKAGTISFAKTSSSSFLTKFDDIKLAVGDGKLLLDGSFAKGYNKNLVQAYTTFDFTMNGSNIVFRDRLDFVETDFSIGTESNKKGSVIVKGDIVVTDGSAHRQFNLRNFVAQAQVSSSSNLVKTLESVDMQLDLDIAVRQFKASARMLNLEIDSILRGQMTARGPIAHPKFNGALFVGEGAIVFPALSFDLVESQIVLHESSAKGFDPKITITAIADLEKDVFGLTQDTTVELSVRGDLDKLNLELKPLSGDRLTQLKIFLLLLSPEMGGSFDSGNQSELLKKGAQNAAMALSEVFLRPLTNELQDILEGKTKTRIQFGSSIEPGGVTFRLSWKLGPRLELQGSYMFVNRDTERGREKSSSWADNSSLGDIKLKLLLFDHRPLGPLFLESSFGSVRQENTYEPRGKIRLKYRVLSK